jgi:hypothetical protein
MAMELKRLAQHMRLSKYKKAKSTAKKAKKKSMNRKERNHVSTARILLNAKKAARKTA